MGMTHRATKVSLVTVFLAVLAMLVAWSLASTTAANATHVVPVTDPGNPDCPAGTIELKVDPVADGTYTDGTLTVIVDVRATAAGQVFDWTSNIGLDAVIAKGIAPSVVPPTMVSPVLPRVTTPRSRGHVSSLTSSAPCCAPW